MVKTRLGVALETCVGKGRALSGSAMASTQSRPLSPHLTVWRWGPNMLVSILHRATGVALTFAGLAILTWWLMSLSQGPEAYAGFSKAIHHPIGLFVLAGLTWSFFQHLFSGIRHLAMDTGAIFELGINKTTATLTILASLIATAALWAFLLGYVK
jgi:succinate dehydrogenase / fumarate reductase cytochrome b subunit